MARGSGVQTPLATRTVERYRQERLRERAAALHYDHAGRDLPRDLTVGRFALTCRGAVPEPVRFFETVEDVLAAAAALVMQPAALVDICDLEDGGRTRPLPLSFTMHFRFETRTPRLGRDRRLERAAESVNEGYRRLYRAPAGRSAGVILETLRPVDRFLLVTSDPDIGRRVRTWERPADLADALQPLLWEPYQVVLVSDLAQPAPAATPALTFEASADVEGVPHRVSGPVELP